MPSAEDPVTSMACLFLQFRQISLGLECGRTALPRRRNCLAVNVVRHIPGRVEARGLGDRPAWLLQNVAIFVEVRQSVEESTVAARDTQVKRCFRTLIAPIPMHCHVHSCSCKTQPYH